MVTFGPCRLSEGLPVCLKAYLPPVSPQPTLNAFMALGSGAWRETRRTLQVLLSDGEGSLRDDVSRRSR